MKKTTLKEPQASIISDRLNYCLYLKHEGKRIAIAKFFAVDTKHATVLANAVTRSFLSRHKKFNKKEHLVLTTLEYSNTKPLTKK